MRAGLPFAPPGAKIGLLGGSFDPAHEGHVHITEAALRRFGLDRIWWLVSPGNPLKAHGPAPLDQRIAWARDIMRNPRVEVTGIEATLGTRMTRDTIAGLQRLYPGVRFVWLMGADNLVQFHKWARWRDILNAVPVAVLARRLKVARSTVQARLERLETSGAIAGYTLRLGDSAREHRIRATCLLTIEPRSQVGILSRLRNMPEPHR